MTTAADNSPSACYFDAMLRPHRSLSPRGFVVLMIAVVVASVLAGSAFFMLGAWPVPSFLGLDVVLIYWAFRANYRSGQAYETVRLTAADLVVEKVDGRGARRRWRLEPYWVRVNMADPPRHQIRLVLSSHGRSLTLGAFLTPTERPEVARALRAALDRRKLAVGAV